MLEIQATCPALQQIFKNELQYLQALH